MNFKVLIYTAIILLPLFFINFRIVAFDTLPFDNYFDYVLYLNGENPDFEFFAPTGYRFLTYGIMAVFYKCLPYIPFSQLSEEYSIEYYKALQAQAFFAYLSQVLFFFLSYIYCKTKLGYKHIQSLSIAAVCFALSFFTYHFGVDHFTMSMLFVVLLLEMKVLLLGLFLLLSIGINEKISLFSMFYFGFRFIASRIHQNKFEDIKPLMFAVISFVLYLAMKYFLSFKGYEYQTDITTFFERIEIAIIHLISFKGLYMNILPLSILGFIVYTARSLNYFEASRTHYLTYTMMALTVFMISMFVSSDFTMGRTCFQILPFFVPLIAHILVGEPS